jgi:beta-galactosidase GanA
LDPVGALEHPEVGPGAAGADAVGFFPWRTGWAGAERHHSAPVPRSGADPTVWREVVAPGQVPRRAADVPAGVEVTRRRGDERSFLSVTNRNDHEVTVPAIGIDPVGRTDRDGTPRISGGGCAPVQERG